jgi:hypothetical protein
MIYMVGCFFSELSKNDTKSLQTILNQLVAGKSSDEEKVKSIYYWVQDNIRYIAFEEVIAGFKPEAAQTVFSNKYGDCKGMANLTKEKEDVYMPYARTFIYTINILIPGGFEVKGLEKFNVNVTNSTGGFISTANVEGNKVVIKTKKYYAHNFEKAANWKDMTAFLEASYNFTQQKLLFKKSQLGYKNN